MVTMKNRKSHTFFVGFRLLMGSFALQGKKKARLTAGLFDFTLSFSLEKTGGVHFPAQGVMAV
jgi:hypothetical protein